MPAVCHFFFFLRRARTRRVKIVVAFVRKKGKGRRKQTAAMPRTVPPNPWAAWGSADMPPVNEIQAALLQPGGGSVRTTPSKLVRLHPPRRPPPLPPAFLYPTSKRQHFRF